MFWSTFNNALNHENPGPVLEANTVYHVAIDITQNQWGIYVNGQLMHEGDKDNHETALTVPCYASFTGVDAADAVIDNIVITPGSSDCTIIIQCIRSFSRRLSNCIFQPFISRSDASDLTSSPTTDPTYEPSNEPTETPTVGDTVFVGPSVMSWADANDYCLQFGRNLVSIHNEEEQEAFHELCDTMDHSGSYGCWYVI